MLGVSLGMTLQFSVTGPRVPGEDVEAGGGGGRPWAHSRAVAGRAGSQHPPQHSLMLGFLPR